MSIYYTKDHEWIDVNGSTCRIGITAYAANQLGDITFIDLPETGKIIKQGDSMCEIESVKAASDIYTPVSGSVKEVNSSLETSPETVNSDPEDSAWIATLELSNPEEVSGLMDEKSYKEYVATLE